MFFSIDDKLAEESAPIHNGTRPIGAPGEGDHNFGFYFFLILNNIIGIVTVVLNFLVTSLIIIHRKKIFGTPFYALAALLMTILGIAGVVSAVNQILFIGFMIRGGAVQWIITGINIYTSYSSVILIWLLGLNRMAIFVLPRLNDHLFRKNRLTFLLISLVVVMMVITVWFAYLIGVAFGNGPAFRSNMDMFYIINTISYCIPLSCCLMYVILYWHLRKNRKSSGKAAYDTLNRAEINTASQGVVILLTYLMSMAMHIAMGYLIPRDGMLKMSMNGIKDILEGLPQLVVPISTIVFSKDMQRLLRSALRIPISSKITSLSSKSMTTGGRNKK